MLYSENWLMWETNLSRYTCLICYERNGRIFSYEELAKIGEPELHPNCRCTLKKIMAVVAGEATFLGTNGADWWLTYLKTLPDYYITMEDAKKLGWVKTKGNLANVAPNCMIFGGVFQNKKKVLPNKEGRIWYEADINYKNGYRNTERIVFSNDGLVFITLDHYNTFIEIIGDDIYE